MFDSESGERMILDIANIARGNVDDVDFSDLTTSQRTGGAEFVDGLLVIPFDPEPSTDEQSAIRLRLMTVDAAEESTVTGLLAARRALADDTTTHGKILRLLVNDRLRDIKA